MSSLDRRQFSLLPLLAAPLFMRHAKAASRPLAATQFPPPPRPESLQLAARILPEGSEQRLQARLEALRAAGFEGLEIVWPGAYRPERVQAIAAQVGLPIHGLRVSEAFGAALSSDDDALRAKGQQRLADALRVASTLGATSLSLVPGAITSEVSDARAWNMVKIALRTALPLAKELDVVIALRLGEGDFLASPLEAARFIDELGSEHIGWQLDSSWSLVRSFPQHWVHILGARIVKFDLADYSRAAARSGGLQAGFATELGAGDVDGPTLLVALAHALYSGWVTIEADEGQLDAKLREARVLLEL